jgi:hypothetical protein
MQSNFQYFVKTNLNELYRAVFVHYQSVLGFQKPNHFQYGFFFFESNASKDVGGGGGCFAN